MGASIPRKLPYADDLLDDWLVGRHLRPLHHADLRPNPRDEQEFASLRHLVAHLDPDVAERALAVRELLLELIEADALGGANDLGWLEFENGPLCVG